MTDEQYAATDLIRGCALSMGSIEHHCMMIEEIIRLSTPAGIDKDPNAPHYTQLLDTTKVLQQNLASMRYSLRALAPPNSDTLSPYYKFDN